MQRVKGTMVGGLGISWQERVEDELEFTEVPPLILVLRTPSAALRRQRPEKLMTSHLVSDASCLAAFLRRH